MKERLIEKDAGEMQMFALGQDVDVADSETGESILHVSLAWAWNWHALY
jgi:hypothetical protein